MLFASDSRDYLVNVKIIGMKISTFKNQSIPLCFDLILFYFEREDFYEKRNNNI